MNNDFSYLKKGDYVFVKINGHYANNKFHLTAVKGVTPTGRIKVEYQDLVFYSDGREYGKSETWRTSWPVLAHYNDENKEEYEKQKIMQRINGYIETIYKNKHKLNKLTFNQIDENAHYFERLSVMLEMAGYKGEAVE